MPDSPARVPAMVCHYAAYLRARAHVMPEVSVDGNRAELRLGVGAKVLVAIFGCRKKTWSLRSVEVRRGEQTTTFTRGKLAKAMAALLGHEPQAPTPLAINGALGPRTDAALRERSTTPVRRRRTPSARRGAGPARVDRAGRDRRADHRAGAISGPVGR